MIETKPIIKMQPWTAVSSWLALVNQTLTDLALIENFVLLHRAHESQPARNSCPWFGLYLVAVVLSFLRSQISLAAPYLSTTKEIGDVCAQASSALQLFQLLRIHTHFCKIHTRFHTFRPKWVKCIPYF